MITLRLLATSVAVATVASVSFAFGAGPGPAILAASGGPVVLMGIDAEDGGIDGHGPIGVYQDIVDSILVNVSNGGSGVLVIGGGKDADDDVTQFWDEIGAGLSIPIAYVNGSPAISAQPFSGFAMLAVVSSEGETPDGGLTEEENGALAARAADVAQFVNSGGGLLGFSQSGFISPYAYVGGLGTFTVETDLGYIDIMPTVEGSAVGITDDLDVCCWHDTYTTFPGFLKVLATVGDKEENAGDVAAIGGAQVVISAQPTVRPRTATPTPKATEEPTATPVPPTETPTAPAPTPTAGVAGVVIAPGAISPPRTGEGTHTGKTAAPTLMLLAGVLVTGGAAAAAGLVWRRRLAR